MRLLAAQSHPQSAFLWRELRSQISGVGEGSVHEYLFDALGPLPFAVRHGTSDILTLAGILSGEYEPPQEVRAHIPACPDVLDLGGNVGIFARWALARLQARSVVSWEPDPENLHILTVNASRWEGVSSWAVTPLAAGVRDESMEFLVGRGWASRAVAAAGPDTTTVKAADVLPVMRTADVIKMDIEGGEWSILADTRLGDIPGVIVVEYHPRGEDDLMPHVDAERLLRRAGFVTHHVPGIDGSRQGLIWAWREHKIGRAHV